MPVNAIRRFIKIESSVGILLFVFAVFALIADNSPMRPFYQSFFESTFAVHLGPIVLKKPLILWINEGFMALFFLLVGLEMKRECYIGELNDASKVRLTAMAALGGMVVPALFYVMLNYGHAVGIRGWAIPMATDIAFALGVLSLLGRRVPAALKVFLTALAVFDDLGAVLVIAFFYTAHIDFPLLLGAFGCILGLFLLNRRAITRLWPYFILGAVLWLCVLKSGVHATLAGVALAFSIPLKDEKNPQYCPLRYLEERLHPWVAYLVLPLFAFANAGVSFHDLGMQDMMHPITLGIVSGLFLGKQVGVMGSCWLAVRWRWATLPYGANWWGIYGVSLLCGIGFTMSLFIGTLAFEGVGAHHGAWLRVGVLVGSLLSALAGYAVLYYALRKPA